MQEFNEKAWGVLTDKERLALQLTLSYSKSSLEAAMVMNIYPYKFAEILARGKKLFFLFSNHFELYADLFPHSIKMDPGLRKYLEALVLKRMTVKKAIVQSPEFGVMRFDKKAPVIIEFFEYLKSSGNSHIVTLLTEFDRWNSFRILPKKLQKPSPFKRRQNRMFKKVYESITGLTEMSYAMIKQKSKGVLPPIVYIPVIGDFVKDNYEVLSFPDSPEVRGWLAKSKFPTFKDRDRAMAMAELIADFYYSRNKRSVLAKKFWPEFKGMLNESTNVKELLGIKDFNQAFEELLMNKRIVNLKNY